MRAAPLPARSAAATCFRGTSRLSSPAATSTGASRALSMLYRSLPRPKAPSTHSTPRFRHGAASTHAGAVCVMRVSQCARGEAVSGGETVAYVHRHRERGRVRQREGREGYVNSIVCCAQTATGHHPAFVQASLYAAAAHRPTKRVGHSSTESAELSCLVGLLSENEQEHAGVVSGCSVKGPHRVLHFSALGLTASETSSSTRVERHA